MRWLLGLLITASVLVFGCSDYAVNKIVETAPEIVVDPGQHDFGNIKTLNINKLIKNCWKLIVKLISDKIVLKVIN